ncbi:carboxylate-amine ligase [Methylobacterium sp. BE186]|uniref:carboxylate-amine ligase n=1 Tax=Methylobacterium sp. BE186 TaxID=2817715 RepID=UPI0028635096|nr:carboxylate-amine ligase [Methylobacterium sp. BE186]MDR7036131.1 carboxylate-amine ligase [Methylobacterium sp. BE186]
MADGYQFGIEEELFLASARSRSAPRRSVSAFHVEAEQQFDSVERELLKNQVEICSAPSSSFPETRAALVRLRSGLAGVGRRHGLLVFAAGTHPTALWPHQQQTEKARYEAMMHDLQIVGRRSIVCGLHVHVEVPRPERRVDTMQRLMPFLPVLLALSTSSPFFETRRTGLAGYRLRAYAELPRTGLPELFHDAADFDRYVKGMTQAGAVKDPTYFWWQIRPSVRYPTLELRVADSCTRIADTITIAALYRCLVRLVDRQPDLHAGMTGSSRGFVMENLWRVERDGVAATLIDERSLRAIPLSQALDEILDLTEEDAAILGCRAECEHARRIAREGSSADRQVSIYEAALSEGRPERDALAAVIDWLADTTAADS